MLVSKVFSVVTLFFFSFYVEQYESAKILFYFGSSIYSHKVAVWPLVLKLAEKGHQITFLSPPFPKDKPTTSSEQTPTQSALNNNVRIFHPKSLVVFWQEKENNNRTRDAITSRVQGYSDGQGYWDASMQNALEICRVIFRSLEVQEWVEAKVQEFDLVVIDTPYNECALALAHRLGCPHILFGTTSLYMWHQEMFGLPDETSWLPNYYYHFPTEMSFLQRVRNALTPLQWFYSTNRVSYIVPQLEKLMRKSLNVTDLPPLDELERSTSLFLLNTHFIQEYPRSLPPFVVPVGGLHLLDRVDEDDGDQELSPDITEFLDKYAENGFIYMSFGTQVEFSRAPAIVIEKFINTFIILEMPVLWKCDDVENAPNEKPKRVHIAKWLPQTAILSHPKIKAFITNGGALSHQEAIFYSVPVIAFPLTPEEDYNSIIIEKSMIGFMMNIAYFTQYELATNVRRLISDVT
ncbi:UDP-glucuronosyltransferase 3A2 [Folsomia candida]|uniref:UDP-glucuronosyltransferase n=2 Tax=Folsomia candida TaxID=158441 RepID=A0A226EVU0_FOLCA|nr:UDP-glucuronosyltransferase 3A2 [Folsomia candida]